MKEIAILSLGLLIFTVASVLIAMFVGSSEKISKKQSLSREIANTLRPSEGGADISLSAKYFEEDIPTYKGWK